MFEAVVQREEIPAKRIGAGLVLAVSVHAAAAFAIVYYSAHHVREATKSTEVVFRAALPPPPPPPPPPPLGGGAVKPKVDQPKKPVPVKKPDTLVEPKQKEEPEKAKEPDKPKETPAGQTEGDPNGDPNGVKGGDAIHGKAGGTLDGGVAGGTGTGTGPVQRTFETIPFGEGLTPSRLTAISPPAVAMPREAREAKVTGKVLVKCVISLSGTPTNCQILKGLPFMDQPVLTALAGAKYQPFTYQGNPVSVIITIPFTIKQE